MRRMYDAVTPQGLGTDRFQVVAGYCGGNTPHVWTKSEWDSTQQRWRLPIWVRSNPGNHDGSAEADLFLAQLEKIGCSGGVTVALDYETAVDSTYLMLFDARMRKYGYETMLYGSLSYVEKNPKPSGGYWVAQWDDISNLPVGTNAHQYINHPGYDESVISDSVVLWDTNPPIPPVTTAIYKADDMLSLFDVTPGKPYFLPVEPAGTATAPHGGARNGPIWVKLAAQSSGTVTLDLLEAGKWVKTQFQNFSVGPGGVVEISLPENGSVGLVRINSTAELVGYVVGRQV